MSMKPEFFCCIGAELKDEIAGSLKSSRIFMYRAAESQTIEDMLEDGFFNDADDLRVNDLILLYCPEQDRSNTFAKVSSISGGIVKTTKLTIDPEDAEIFENTYVKKSGDTMTGELNIENIASSNTPLLTLTHSNTATYKWNIAPRYNSTTLSVYPGSTETNGFRFATTGFVPASNNARYLGSASLKWKGVYTGVLNNGADLVVPNKAGTLATMDDVDLAANSGDQLTEKGVWYAKMYSATVAPSAEDGTNYADFSQTDGQGNPIIVIYKRQNGAWVQDQTITPPAEYNGYVPVTSKIWDIVEQSGQQGGKVLWSHNQKTFTPSPLIISFEDIEVTGDSTVVMPQNPGANQIVNKDYVDEAIASIPTPTVDVTQSIDAEIVGTLTVADNGDVSGFTNNNYLALPGTLVLNNASSFEFVFVFTTGSNVAGGSIMSPVGDGNYIEFTINSSSKYQYLVKHGNNSQSGTGTAPALTANTKYYRKLEFDGTYYNSYMSSDGVNWTSVGLATANYFPEFIGQYVLGQQDISGNGISILHMAECYIKKNGVIIWQGMDAPGLHQRVPVGHEVIAFQAPTTGNNYTWYRKYADGWVEQGSSIDSAVSGTYTVTFPVSMADTHYTILKTMSTNSSSGAQYNQISFFNKTTTSAETNTAGVGFSWQVSGMAQG